MLFVAITDLIRDFISSAIVGFASIILLLPVPGYLASRMQKIQTEKMERVGDNRLRTTWADN